MSHLKRKPDWKSKMCFTSKKKCFQYGHLVKHKNLALNKWSVFKLKSQYGALSETKKSEISLSVSLFFFDMLHVSHVKDIGILDLYTPKNWRTQLHSALSSEK